LRFFENFKILWISYQANPLSTRSLQKNRPEIKSRSVQFAPLPTKLINCLLSIFYSRYPNLPILKSLQASRISSLLFITKGPCAAIGSLIGAPDNNRTTDFSSELISNSSPSFSNINS